MLRRRRMHPDDTDLALRCLALAADLRQLDYLVPERRRAVLSEATTLMELLAEVFSEPEYDPSRN